MNKQEVIEKIEGKRTGCDDTIWGGAYDEAIDDASAIVRQLDEPEKPVVPQFVADWYEEHKDDFEDSVYDFCIQFSEERLNDDLYKWFCNDDNKPIQTLANMHQFGYEVKKEKLYTVELPSPNDVLGGHFTLRRDTTGKVVIERHTCERWKKSEDNQLTEAEIKKDFAWAWQFAEEVEE